MIGYNKSIWQGYMHRKYDSIHQEHRDYSEHLAEVIKRVKPAFESKPVTSGDRKRMFGYLKTEVTIPLVRYKHVNVTSGVCQGIA